jgi:hypothetical protein
MGLLKRMMKGLGDIRPHLSPSQQSQIPTFEQLEPRLLLSADASFFSNFQPLDSFGEQVISVDLKAGLGASEVVASGELLVASKEIEEGLEEQKVGSEGERNEVPGDLQNGQSLTELISHTPCQLSSNSLGLDEPQTMDFAGHSGAESRADSGAIDSAIEPHNGLAADVGNAPNNDGQGIEKVSCDQENTNNQQPTTKIYGSKWHDLDGDCIWDTDEPALPDWTIYLDCDEDGTWDDSTTTGPDGAYSFDGLYSGTHVVGEDLQFAWDQTYPIEPETHTVILAPGQVVTDIDFGNKLRPPSYSQIEIMPDSSFPDSLDYSGGRTFDYVIDSVSIAGFGPGLGYNWDVTLDPLGDRTEVMAFGENLNLDSVGGLPDVKVAEITFSGGVIDVLVDAPFHITEITSSPGGSVTNPPDGATDFYAWFPLFYEIEATPEPGFHFVSWSGSAVDVSKVQVPLAASTRLVAPFEGAHTLHADFAPDAPTDITVDLPVGGGITEIYVENGNVIVRRDSVILLDIPAVALNSLTINGAAGDNDTFQIDLSPPGLPSPITVNGGAGGNDTLEVINGLVTTANFTFDNPNDGSVNLDGTAINYTGLEPITSTINATNVMLNYSGVSETITVTDAGAGQTTVDSTAGEVTTFTHPTGTLTINAGSGNDTVDITSLAADYPAHVTINGQGDMDTVSFDGNVSLRLGKNLSVTADTIKVNSELSTSGIGNVSLNADRNIGMHSGSSITTVNGDILLEANPAGAVGGSFVGIHVNHAVVTANGAGAITVSGRGGDTSGDDGVAINGSTLRVVDGDLQILGNASHGPGSSDGIDIGAGSVIESTGTASITITGTSGSGSSSDGVEMSDSAVLSVDGTISISGDASGAGNSADGVELDDSSVSSQGGGIRVIGHSELAGSSADGIDINDSSIQSATGHIRLTGTATGAGSSADGVELAAGAKIQTTDTGPITIMGMGQADGVYVTGAATELRSIHGAISIDGTGGGVSSAEGVHISGNLATVCSINGDIQITGNSGGDDDGVEVNNGAQVISTGAGPNAATITISGMGGSGTTDYGVELAGAGTLVSSVGGNISIIGTSPGGDGTYVANAAVVNSIGTGPGAAQIEITGTGGGVSSSEGVMITGVGTAVTSSDGDIRVIGDSGGDDDGVEIHSGAAISSTGRGADAATISLHGTGGSGTTDYGVELADAGTGISSTDGNISIVGASPGGDGVYIGSEATIVSIGTGLYAAQINVEGTGGGVSSSEGVMITGVGTAVTSIDGDIRVIGDSGGDDDGVEIHGAAVISSTGSGPDAATITVNGTGGSGTTDYGVELADAGTTLTAVDGNISLVGASPGGDGVYVGSGAVISSTGVGTDAAHVDIEGTGGGVSSSEGVHITGIGTVVKSIDGDIQITGDSGGDDDGVELDNGAQIASAGTGPEAANITMTGVGGSGSTDYGIELAHAGTLVLSVAGSIELTASDSVATGDDLMVNSGVTVQSTGSDVTLQGGDNVIVAAGSTVDAAGKVTIVGDFSDADPGVGTTIDVLGTLKTVTQAEILGEADDDQITLAPDATVGTIRLNGQGGDDSYVVHFGNLGGLVDVGDQADEGADDLTIDATSVTDTLTVTPIQATLAIPAQTVTYTAELENLGVRSLDEQDVVNVAPSLNATINVFGGVPAAILPGDTLHFTMPVGQSSTLTITGSDSGIIATSGGYQDVVFDEIESLGFSGDLVINGTGSDDTLEVTAAAFDSGNMQLSIGAVAGLAINFEGLGSLMFNGGDGSDELIINHPAGGLFAPAHGIVYNGQGAGGASDTLAINGGSATTVTYAYTNDGSPNDNQGTVYWDGTVLTYTGLEPINSTINAANVILNYSAAGETITVTDAGIGQTTVDSTAGETTTFTQPTGTLTINAGAGDGTIDITSLAAGYPAHVTINGQGGTDTVSFDGTVSLASDKHLTVTADTIEVNADLSTSGMGSVSLNADRNIDMNSGSSIATINGDIILQANFAGAVTGSFVGIDVDGAVLTSTGTGTIAVSGRGGDTSGDDGIAFDKSSVRAFNGDIQLTGHAGAGTSSSDGVDIGSDSVLECTGTGSISIEGRSGSGSSSDGVEISDTSIRSIDGVINISGVASHADSSCDGVELDDSLIESVSAGIQITGNSSFAGSSADGVDVNDSVIQSASGHIQVMGRATGAGSSADGVELAGGALLHTTDSGSITIMGAGQLDGVYVTGTATEISSVQGAITIHGIGGGLASSEGVHMTGDLATVTSAYGDIRITGDSGGEDDGVEIHNGTVIASTGTGEGAATITVIGTGGSGTTDYGVELAGAGTLISSADGSIQITGASPGGDGVYIGAEAVVCSTGTGTQAAQVSIEGTGGGLPSDEGVHITGIGTAVTSIDGDIQITGDSGGDDDGVEIDNGARVCSTGAGAHAANITITGIGDSGSTDYGVEISGAGTYIASVSGHIDIAGTSEVAEGISIGTGTAVASTGENGAITLTANDLALTGTVNAGAGQVTILPSQPGLSFDLGSTSGSGQFVITDAEFDRIFTTDRIRIGDAHTGDITFTGAVDPAGADTLELISGARIADTNTRNPDYTGTELILRGNVAPGHSPGVFSVDSNLELAANHRFSIEIGGATPGTTDHHHDQLDVYGTVLIGSNVTLKLESYNGFVPGPGDTLVIVNNDGVEPVVGTFAGLPEGSAFSSFLGSEYRATISYQGGDGNDITIAGPEVTVTTPIHSVVEDDGTPLNFLFQRTGNSDEALTVNFSIAGNAELNRDYAQIGVTGFTATSGAVTFAAGSSTAVITVDALADMTVEADEVLILTLKPGTDYDTGDACQAIGTILDDDTAALTIADLAQAEDSGFMTFTVMLSHAVQGGLTVDPQTTDGSATVGDNDYDAAAGTLSFAGLAGESNTFTVNIIADGQVEFDEAFAVSLDNVVPKGTGVHATDIDTTDTALGIILRDDAHDITDLVSMDEVQVIYDHQNGQKTVDLLVMSHTMQTLYRPLQLTVEVDDINRSFVSLGNGDGLTFDGKPYVDLTDLTGDSQMDLGELVRVRLVFDGGATCFFDYTLSLRGMLADQAPPVDTEAPQASVDLLPTYDPTPALTGTVDDPQATVDVWLEGRWYKTTNRGDGTWRILDVIHPALTPGQYDVLVRATDPAGNGSQATFSDALSILAPEPPIVEVDDPSTLLAVEIKHDYQTGQLHVSVLVENRTERTIKAPIPLVVEEIDSPFASLAKPDGLTEDGKPYLDIAKSLNDGQLDSGELVRVELVFNNALGSSFGCRLRTRGIFDEDPNASVDPVTPPEMITQSLPKVSEPVIWAPIVTLEHLASEVEAEPVDGLVKINVLQQQFNHQTGSASLGGLVTNRSAQRIQGPLQLTVNQVSSPLMGLPRPSGRTGNGLAYLDLSSYLDNVHFKPNQSIFASPSFNNAARCHFEFDLGIHDFRDWDDDNWPNFSR